ncbi:hypothetical protein [Rossellomorea sp. KS-H15a]|uniref:hypothetical protein n=1 Tax=Rossellomorea sp. KS-H15a TaxID=2963940 RepID=UPI0020C6C4FD|nr:hypothetical protein [Rossellomorea sp. KS-H15a]UTE77323.1 hypothetical protein M1J35_00300 [Rossellomorea sp. KS-H15a]
MIVVGIPVTILAGVVTRKMKQYIHIINFIIHILPAFLVSVIMFGHALPLLSMPYAGVPIFASTIFYVVDEVIYQKIDLRGRFVKGIFLIPAAVYLLYVGPSLYTGFLASQSSTQINEKGSPKVSLTFDGEEIPIKSSYCWTPDGEGCVYGTDPFPLPEEKVKNVKEITMTSPATLDFSFENSEGEPTIYAYYHDGKDFKEIEEAGNKINISNDIPEQAIKFVVKWDNNEMVKFFVGVRTGILTNGRTF